MTHRDVIVALINGEKLTKSSWKKDEYIVLIDDFLIDEFGQRAICVFSDNERLGKWKLYEDNNDD